MAHPQQYPIFLSLAFGAAIFAAGFFAGQASAEREQLERDNRYRQLQLLGAECVIRLQTGSETPGQVDQCLRLAQHLKSLDPVSETTP